MASPPTFSFKCRLCAFRSETEQDMILHCIHHEKDHPMRAWGGNLEEFINREMKKPRQYRRAPFLRRLEGITGATPLDLSFVHLSVFCNKARPARKRNVKRPADSPCDSVIAKQPRIPDLRDLTISTPIPLQTRRISSKVQCDSVDQNLTTQHPSAVEIVENSKQVPVNDCTAIEPPQQAPAMEISQPSPALTLASKSSCATTQPPMVNMSDNIPIDKPSITHPLSSRRRNKAAKPGTLFSCHKCSLNNVDQSTMESHYFGVHDLKDLVLICQLCQGHFCSGSEMQAHMADLHVNHYSQTAKEYPSHLIDTKIVSYRAIPFCRNCNYRNFNLFTRDLGCHCKNHKPVAGLLHEYKGTPSLTPAPVHNVKFDYKQPPEKSLLSIAAGVPMTFPPTVHTERIKHGLYRLKYGSQKLTKESLDLVSSTVSACIDPPSALNCENPLFPDE